MNQDNTLPAPLERPARRLLNPSDYAGWEGPTGDEVLGAMLYMAGTVLAVAAVLVAAVVLALLLAGCEQPSELQAERDVATLVTDARIDEWVQAAQRANPGLTPEEAARVRAAARVLEGGRE